MNRLLSVAVLACVALSVLPAGSTPAGASAAVDERPSIGDSYGMPPRPEPSASARVEREREQTRTASSAGELATSLYDDYYDTCDDTGSHDLARFGMSDDQASDVTFGWATCNGKPLRSTPDEVVAFEIDGDLDDPYFRNDFVVLQWADDGYFAVYRTYNGAPSDRWTLVDDGFGLIVRENPGNTQGYFAIDASAVGFPYAYFFSVLTFAGDTVRDIIPNPHRPYPTFPSLCDTEIARRSALVRTSDVAAASAAATAAGLTVSSPAPGVGALTVAPVDDLDALRLPGQTSVTRPGMYELTGSNDPEPTQWAIDQLDLEYAWQLRSSARNEIAIVDSGIDAGRPDLAGRVATGYDAVSGQVIPAGTNSAYNAHGTAVAAIAAGTRNNGREVAGVNGGAIVRPYVVTSHNGPCVEEGAIVAALDHIATVDSIRIVNMSFGTTEMDPAVRDAVRRVAATGKILIAATGNDGETGKRANFPAGFDEVIGIGATGPSGTVASYSQQANVEFVGPGGAGITRDTGVALLHDFDTVTHGTGTSFSAPYIAGAVSLWLDSNRATTDQARAALRTAAVDIPGTTGDGAGLIHVPTLLRGQATPSPEPSEPVDRPTATAVETSAECDRNQDRGFPDTAGNVHEYHIRCIVGWAITQGRADGTYGPRASVSRGQVATFLTRTLEAAGVAVPAGADAPDAYTDDQGDTHEESLNRLAALNIPAERQATVRPNVSATRAEMAEWVVAALRYAGATHDDGRDFYHDDEGHRLETFINDLTAFGVVTGNGDGTYAPDTSLNRAQMGTFLARALTVARR